MRSYLQHGRRHTKTGSDPIAGLGVGPTCFLSQENNSSRFDAHSVSTYAIKWDTLYDNSVSYNPLTSIPDGLGLSFVFDGTNANITAEEDGYWYFNWFFNVNGDSSWFAASQLSSISAANSLIPPSFIAAPNQVRLTDSYLTFIPSGTLTWLSLNVNHAASVSPYLMYGAGMTIVRLG